MSQFRTFRADTMSEALSLVRREMGPDALIVRTRQVPVTAALPWRKAKYQTEIVAAMEVEGVENAVRPTAPNRPAPKPTQVTPEANPSRIQEAPQRSRIQESESKKLEALVQDRLESLQKMVEDLTAEVRLGASNEIPKELLSVFTELIDADVEEGYARELIGKLKRRCTPQELSDTELLSKRLFELVESEVICSDPIRVTPGQRRISALIGPTGVGKTTTIAKLAANHRLRDGSRLGLITVDTYRIAAVDQLRTYAEIIEIPMRVVSSAAEMKQAVNEFADKDLILIDTAGRSPQDDVKLQELKEVLSEIVVDDIFLVLSATASHRHLRMTIDKFQDIAPTAAILTKLDEATEFGTLVNVSNHMQLPLSYMTTGQNVPHDIEPAHPSRAANLILGRESLQTQIPTSDRQLETVE